MQELTQEQKEGLVRVFHQITEHAMIFGAFPMVIVYDVPGGAKDNPLIVTTAFDGSLPDQVHSAKLRAAECILESL